MLFNDNATRFSPSEPSITQNRKQNVIPLQKSARHFDNSHPRLHTPVPHQRGQLPSASNVKFTFAAVSSTITLSKRSKSSSDQTPIWVIVLILGMSLCIAALFRLFNRRCRRKRSCNTKARRVNDRDSTHSFTWGDEHITSSAEDLGNNFYDHLRERGWGISNEVTASSISDSLPAYNPPASDRAGASTPSLSFVREPEPAPDREVDAPAEARNRELEVLRERVQRLEAVLEAGGAHNPAPVSGLPPAYSLDPTSPTRSPRTT
ncbi:hypothetical protein AN958_04259 [Leucoagaricus sp. SymC.cos]|nr:hypothetical protein AN958_04259 [Leucoagaricus sp. SymC.cos]